MGINIFDDGDFGSGLDNVVQTDPNIAPGYRYSIGSASPNDGFYTLTNNTGAWGFKFPSWLDISDNSPDPNGYMMVVNASYEPGIFYTQEVSGLCENTLYEFSADIINIVRISVPNHIEPNLDFLIDDAFRFSTGNVPQDAKWHKYGFTFTTSPGQTSVKLSLRNNAPGGGGNDLALDNISFQACGPAAFVNAEQTIFLCENTNLPTEIRADISASNQALQWQFSTDGIIWDDIALATAESIAHSTFDVGKYYYRYLTAGTEVELLNEKCRVISNVLVVEVLQLNYDIDTTICYGDALSFGSQTLDEAGVYTEMFVSSQGCDSLVELSLLVLDQEMLTLDTLLVDPLCYGDNSGSIEIAVVNGSYGPYSYAINDVSMSSNLFEDLSAGVYPIRITNDLGCESRVDLALQNPDEFTISVPEDFYIELGESIDVTVIANQEVDSLVWNLDGISPCGACLDFSFLPVNSGVYTATAYNAIGCEATDGFIVKIDIKNLPIYIPNIFAPRGTGVEDSFTIGAKEGLISNIRSFHVYDRWGNLIHHVENTTDFRLWDGYINGKAVKADVYVYLLKVELIDGNEYNFAGDLFVMK